MPPADVPMANVVDGLALPADLTVSAEEGFIELAADCTGDVQFAVLGSVPVKFKIAGKSVIVATPARGGQIVVLAVGLVDGKLTSFVRCTVTVTPAGPVAPPAPAPPTPAPTPVVSGKIFVTIVTDAANQSPAQAAVAASAALRQLAQSRGQIRAVDKADPWLKEKKLDSFTNQVNAFPAILVQDEQGVVRLAAKLPDTEAAAIAMLKGVLGP